MARGYTPNCRKTFLSVDKAAADEWSLHATRQWVRPQKFLRRRGIARAQQLTQLLHVRGFGAAIHKWKRRAPLRSHGITNQKWVKLQ